MAAIVQYEDFEDGIPITYRRSDGQGNLIQDTLPNIQGGVFFGFPTLPGPYQEENELYAWFTMYLQQVWQALYLPSQNYPLPQDVAATDFNVIAFPPDPNG